jgi:hypothetical protein
MDEQRWLRIELKHTPRWRWFRRWWLQRAIRWLGEEAKPKSMRDSPTLADAIGKTVKAVSQELQHHTLDNVTDESGAITITFMDGCALEIVGVWCNDDLADTCYEWKEALEPRTPLDEFPGLRPVTLKVRMEDLAVMERLATVLTDTPSGAYSARTAYELGELVLSILKRQQ